MVARTIAAHLTLESDRILREGYRRMLSAQQVKSLLMSAVSDHLHKLNRVAALELTDGISTEDGRRSDLVVGWALRLKAARGPNATVAPGDYAAIIKSGLSSDDIVEIDQTIALLRDQGDCKTPRAKILRMLEGCGASQTPGDIVETQSILYRGQAAALMAVDRRWSGCFKEDDDLVDRGLSRSAADAAPVISTATPLQNAAPIDPSGIERVASVPRSDFGDASPT